MSGTPTLWVTLLEKGRQGAALSAFSAILLICPDCLRLHSAWRCRRVTLSGMKEVAHPGPQGERWTVDAVEDSPLGPVVRLEREDGRTFTLPLHALPEGLREGDILAVQEGPDGVSARLLPAETQARRAAAQARLDALNSQDLDLDDGEITL